MIVKFLVHVKWDFTEKKKKLMQEDVENVSRREDNFIAKETERIVP